MSDDDNDRYSFTRDYRLIDTAPNEFGESTLEFDVASGKWLTFDGLCGQVNDSIPVTSEEAQEYCRKGVVPKHVRDAIANDTGYYPEPFDD